MYSGEYGVCDVTLSVYPHRASLKHMPTTYDPTESNLRPLEYQPNDLPTELRGQVGSSMTVCDIY